MFSPTWRVSLALLFTAFVSKAVYGEPQARRPQLLREVAELGDTYLHTVSLLSVAHPKNDSQGSLPRAHKAQTLPDSKSTTHPVSPHTLTNAAPAPVHSPKNVDSPQETPPLRDSTRTLISREATGAQNSEGAAVTGQAISTPAPAAGAHRRRVTPKVNPDNPVSRAAKRAFLLQGGGPVMAGNKGYAAADTAAARSLQGFNSRGSYAGIPTTATGLSGEDLADATPQAPQESTVTQLLAEKSNTPVTAVPMEAAPMPRSAASVLKSVGVPAHTAFTPFTDQNQDVLLRATPPTVSGPNPTGSAVKPTWWATPTSSATDQRHAPAPKFASAEAAKEYSDAYKYPVPKPSTMSKYARPQNMDPKYVAPTARAESQAASITPESGFVQRSGTRFEVDGRPVFFVGTNADYLQVTDWTSTEAVEVFFKKASESGFNITRLFAFSNGFDWGDSLKSQHPIQPEIGVFNETTLQRLDLLVAKGAEYGVRMIMVLVNYEKEIGGMQWYVDNVLGQGYDKELFYTEPTVMQSFKNYLQKIILRKNTISGVAYKDDPAILAWELANEPHTSDYYEVNRGLKPGSLLNGWLCQMSAFVKELDPKHLVSSGEEGYSTTGPQTSLVHGWLSSGAKGADYASNLACPNIDFGTLHIYPSNWGFPTYGEDNYTWIRDNYIKDRAAVAFSLDKPYIIEEYGMPEGYLPTRDTLLKFVHQAANEFGSSAVLVWQIFAWPVGMQPAGSYNFDWTPDTTGRGAMFDQVAVAAQKNAGTWSDPVETGAIKLSGKGCACADLAPNATTTCAALKSAGMCDSDFMTNNGKSNYCALSCNRCKPCLDTPPNTDYTCEQQSAWGKCTEAWMVEGNFCAQSCQRCSCEKLPSGPSGPAQAPTSSGSPLAPSSTRGSIPGPIAAPAQAPITAPAPSSAAVPGAAPAPASELNSNPPAVAPDAPVPGPAASPIPPSIASPASVPITSSPSTTGSISLGTPAAPAPNAPEEVPGEEDDLPAEAPAPLVISAPGVDADPGVDIVPATDDKANAPEEVPTNPVIMVSPNEDDPESGAATPPTVAEMPSGDDKGIESPSIAPAWAPGPSADDKETETPMDGGTPAPSLDSEDGGSPTEAAAPGLQPQGTPTGTGVGGDGDSHPGAPQPDAGNGANIPGSGPPPSNVDTGMDNMLNDTAASSQLSSGRSASPPKVAPGPQSHRKAFAPGPSGQRWWVGSGLPERTGGWRERLKEEHPVPETAPSRAPSACEDVAGPNMPLTCSQQALLGQCRAPWMLGYCLKSCGFCGPCSDTVPQASALNCTQWASAGMCAIPLTALFCDASCGRCKPAAVSMTASAIPPATNPRTFLPTQSFAAAQPGAVQASSSTPRSTSAGHMDRNSQPLRSTEFYAMHSRATKLISGPLLTQSQDRRR